MVDVDYGDGETLWITLLGGTLLMLYEKVVLLIEIFNTAFTVKHYKLYPYKVDVYIHFNTSIL